jgi:O-acetyl-ADP-ribose deacetylase (regulator of RNase III)
VDESASPYADCRPLEALESCHGDATRPSFPPAIIVHVCNDVGGWGAGFVLAISKRWKAPEREYRAAFASDAKPQLGDVQFVAVEPGLWVANMIAQHRVGRSTDGKTEDSSDHLSPFAARNAGEADRGPVGPRSPIRYDAVRSCLAQVAPFACERGARVHMPRIGCGLAGGKWEEIEPIIRDTLLAAGIGVTVYDFP